MKNVLAIVSHQQEQKLTRKKVPDVRTLLHAPRGLSTHRTPESGGLVRQAINRRQLIRQVVEALEQQIVNETHASNSELRFPALFDRAS